MGRFLIGIVAAGVLIVGLLLYGAYRLGLSQGIESDPVANDFQSNDSTAQTEEPTATPTSGQTIAAVAQERNQLATKVAELEASEPEQVIATATPLPPTATQAPSTATSVPPAATEEPNVMEKFADEKSLEGISRGAGMGTVQSGNIPTVEVPQSAWAFDGDGGSFWVDGGVETATNIEQATGQFDNTLGMGSQSWLAEPGKLLVNGFDFDLEAMKGSGGAIEHWNPTNQQIFGWMPPAFWNLNEGGFILGVGNRMTIQVPDRATFHVEGDDTTAWMVIMRGNYSDFNTPSDRNLNLTISDYVPGNIMFVRYPGTPNGGFISEGQFLQIAQTTQSGWNDCGQSGCPHLYVLFYDANTGAWLVLHRATVNGAWEAIASNMDYLQ